MKNYALLAIAAIGTLAACSKNEVAPQQPIQEESGEPVPVLFSVGSPAISTRATGVVGGVVGENQNNWDSQQLYIYGFNRETVDFSAGEAAAFIWHIPSDAPETGATGGITVLNPDPTGTGAPATPEPFYYKGKEVYDFYGCHVDDAYYDSATGLTGSENIVPVAVTEGVYIPFKIDGGQDLMIAKANPADDIAAAGATAQTVAQADAYSAYAARRGVQPNLVFKHQLARFTFEIVAGSASADSVEVESIALVSKTTGRLYVVGSDDVRGISNVEDATADLYLRDKSAEGILVPLEPKGTDPYVADGENNAVRIGESIMVIPDESEYVMKLALRHKNENINTPIEPEEYTISAAKLEEGDPEAGTDTFKAGFSYNVTIKIYGLEKVEITATLEEWKDGGHTTIDPDESPSGN